MTGNEHLPTNSRLTRVLLPGWRSLWMRASAYALSSAPRPRPDQLESRQRRSAPITFVDRAA